MRRLLPLLALGCVAEPTEDDHVPQPGLAWCTGATTQRYDPLVDSHLAVFPDDVWTRADPGSPTGLRVDLSRAPWVDQTPTQIVDVRAPLEVLSGFGRLGAVVVGLSAPPGALPATAEASLTDPGLLLVDLSTSPPTRVPYRASVGPLGTQLHVQPLRTLRPGTAHALVLTTAHVAADGACVRPSATTRDLLAGTPEDPALAAHAPRVRAAAEALGLAVDEVSAISVFTTHDDAAILAEAIADARGRRPGWSTAPSCRPDGNHRRCDGVLRAWDYRHEGGGVLDTDTPVPWDLPVSIWLPAGAGPHATLVTGHGMNGSRGEGPSIARGLLEEGFALVSSDALFHGGHPTAVPGQSGALPFLGLDLDAARLDAGRLRGAFQQSALDRAQVLAALRLDPDVDGDDQPDLDLDTLGYLGVSLGALLGPGLLALDGGVRAGALPVGGGHLVTFATDNSISALFQSVFEIAAGDAEAWQRIVAVMQATLDPGDPAVLGAHVLQDRLDDAAAPDLLLQVALFDEIVPPETGRMLARGLGLPTVGLTPAAPEDLPLLAAPTSGQGPDGATVGWTLFDRVTRDAAVQAASHDNTPWSAEAWLQTTTFLRTWRAGDTELVDPYAELGTPPLP